jgi:glycosyltransferase involved in cell wall biosynthesis
MKISVIIPTYNSEKTIRRTLASVLEQEGRGKDYEIEIIVCDDCSIDKTVRIAREYGATVIVRHKGNSGGPNWGRNEGISHATGDYIAFLDHDDQWLPGKIAHQLKILEGTGHDLAYSTFIQEGTTDNVIVNSNIYECLFNYSFPNGGIYLGSILVRNKSLPRFLTKWLDFDWLLDLTCARKCVQTVPMVRRTIDGNNLSLNPQYRQDDYYLKVGIIKNKKSLEKINGSYARYFYVCHNGAEARRYFRYAHKDWKAILYYLTSYSCTLRRWIIKKYRVFG